MYHVIYTRQTAKDAKKLKSCGVDTKAKELIAIIKENPFQNPPAYEKLVGNLQGNCLRRVNIQYRLVYKVIGKSISIKALNNIREIGRAHV